MSMRKLCLLFCLLLFVRSQLFAQHGFVHTSGADVIDGNGKPLMLRGTNIGNWLEPEGYMFHFDGGPQSPLREMIAVPLVPCAKLL